LDSIEKICLFFIIENADQVLLEHLILAIYYLSWIGGLSFDVFMQKRIYRKDSLRGTMSRQAFIAVAALFLLAVAVLWPAETEQRSSIFPGIFLIVNLYAWRVSIMRIAPVIDSTKDSSESLHLAAASAAVFLHLSSARMNPASLSMAL
jgi:uncharacterized protein involved in response to NO